MMQRLQSLFLAAIVIASILLFAFPIGTIQENGAGNLILKVSGVYESGINGLVEKTRSFLLPQINNGLITIFAVASFSVFRNRRLQMLLTGLNAILSLLLSLTLIILLYKMNSDYYNSLKISISAFLPVLMILLNILAYKGIKKDDDLVKSLDRLR